MVATPEKPELKECTWENVEIGEQFGPIDLVVDDHRLKSYAYAIDAYHPRYSVESPLGERIAPSALLVNPLLSLYQLRYDRTTVMGLHAHEELELYGPVKLGQQVSLQATFTDKYVRRGKGYTVLTSEARSESGELLIRARQTEVFRIPSGLVPGQRTAAPSGEMVTGHIPATAPMVKHASRQTPVGAVVPPKSRLITHEQVSVYSFGWRNIHTDREFAVAAGLEGPIAQGAMSTCYLSEMLTDLFGELWFSSGCTSHAFIKPVYIGDTITTQGVVRELVEEPEGMRLVLQVWCRNQKGELTTVGTASALVA